MERQDQSGPQTPDSLLPVPFSSGLPEAYQPRMLLMACAGPLTTFDNQMVALMRGDPTLIRKTGYLAYQHPDLIDIRGREGTIPPTLQSIRNNLPGVINRFDEIAIREALDRFPLLSGRVEEDMRALAEMGVTEVKPIEIALRLLLTNGSLQGKTRDDYPQVVESHNLYGVLATNIFDDRMRIPKVEELAFIQIGQSLLKTRLIYEARDPEYDEKKDSVVPHTDREKDYEGILAMFVATRRLIGILDHDSQKDPVLLRALNQENAAFVEHLFSFFPDKVRDFRSIVGNPEGVYKFMEYTDEPGGPSFTRAEMIDFLNEGR